VPIHRLTKNQLSGPQRSSSCLRFKKLRCYRQAIEASPSCVWSKRPWPRRERRLVHGPSRSWQQNFR
jgi:hypothetical protein